MPDEPLPIDLTFTALSDPTRRAVLQHLSGGPASVSQLAGAFAMALPSFTQHLAVLERARLIRSRKEGRVRICALDADALREAEDWLATQRRQWEARMDRFAAHVQSARKDPPDEQD